MSLDALDAYGWTDARADALTAVAPGAAPGRVLRHDGVAVMAVTRAGTRQIPLLPGCDPVVVGDWVGIIDEYVAHVLPRTSLLRRRDAIEESEHPLVSNIDEVLIVCGLDRPVKAGRIQRMVTLATDAGADAMVVLTKADLGVDLEVALETAAAAAPDVDTAAVSATTGLGIDALRAHCAGRTVTLLGESGAGKSTLVNALMEEEVAATDRVRHGDAKGRHTTTARELHLLPGGGVLVDTPGIRAVGVWVDPEAVDAAFEDLVDLAAQCRFADCAHEGEPGCAVRAAIGEGTVSAARLAAWADLRAEAADAEATLAAKRARAGRRRRPG